MGAVEFGHFNGLQNVVSPIQVPTHPVYSKALCYSYATVEYLLGKSKLKRNPPFSHVQTGAQKLGYSIKDGTINVGAKVFSQSFVFLFCI